MSDGALHRASLAAGVILQRDDGKIALVLRSNKPWMNHHYSMTSGRVEPGESMLESAAREASEEAGVAVAVENLEHAVTTFDMTSTEEPWIEVIFVAKKWDGEPYNAEPDEHSALDWFDPGNLPENIVPRHATTLRAFVDKVRYVEHG